MGDRGAGIEIAGRIAAIGVSSTMQVFAQAERMRSQLNDFFGIVEKMRAVDTTGIEPLAHPVATIQDIALRLREDRVSESNQREANQQNAPALERGLFLVPKVIE